MKKVGLKKWGLCSLSCLLILGLCACGDSVSTPDVSSSSAMAYADYDYENMVGWWVRPEGYQSVGMSILDYFYLGEDGCWTGYDQYGAENGLGGDAWIEDGYLALTGIFDDAEAIYIPIESEDTLVDEEGNAYYVKTYDPEFGEGADLTGTWYLSGNFDADNCYVFFDDGTCQFVQDGEVSEDRYYVRDVEGGAPDFNDVQIGQDWNYRSVSFENDVFKNLTLIAGENALLDESGDQLYYIHENAMADENVKLNAELLVRTWYSDSEDDDSTLYFTPNGGVAFYYEEGTSPRSGMWELSASDLTVYWDDGDIAYGTIYLCDNFSEIRLDCFADGFNNKSLWDF